MNKSSMKAITSHASDEWETPQKLFDTLDAEFHFEIDACATDTNHKCARYYTKENDGLKNQWGGYRVFCNPPYSGIEAWARKAFTESREPGTVICMLVPSRTDTKWFQNYVYHRAEVRFIRGRLRFSSSAAGAPFPSMVIIWRGPET